MRSVLHWISVACLIKFKNIICVCLVWEKNQQNVSQFYWFSRLEQTLKFVKKCKYFYRDAKSTTPNKNVLA